MFRGIEVIVFAMLTFMLVPSKELGQILYKLEKHKWETEIAIFILAYYLILQSSVVFELNLKNLGQQMKSKKKYQGNMGF